MVAAIPGLELDEAVGQGGYATVYRARQVSMDRVVAVKIDHRMLATERAQQRFAREITSVVRLSGHPHVVTVHDAGVTPDWRPYLVMQLCPGGSLQDRLDRSGPLAWRDVVRLGIATSDALEASHRAGVLHRDIKPGNILLDEQDRALLSDFGIAAILSPTGPPSATREVWTPGYAAPEIQDGGPPCAASDVYSLAITLYTLLTGRIPVSEPGRATTWSRRPRGHLLAELDGVPGELVAVLRAATHPDPLRRTASALALRRGLLAVQEQGCSRARRRGVATRVRGLRPPALRRPDVRRPDVRRPDLRRRDVTVRPGLIGRQQVSIAVAVALVGGLGLAWSLRGGAPAAGPSPTAITSAGPTAAAGASTPTQGATTPTWSSLISSTPISSSPTAPTAVTPTAASGVAGRSPTPGAQARKQATRAAATSVDTVAASGGFAYAENGAAVQAALLQLPKQVGADWRISYLTYVGSGTGYSLQARLIDPADAGHLIDCIGVDPGANGAPRPWTCTASDPNYGKSTGLSLRELHLERLAGLVAAARSQLSPTGGPAVWGIVAPQPAIPNRGGWWVEFGINGIYSHGNSANFTL